MDLNPKGWLRTSILLLILSRVVCTKGLSHNLHCVSDYVSTINCTLQSNLSTDLAMWLKLENEEAVKENTGELLCHLSWNNDRFYCSVECDAFGDTDVYQISLCERESTCCKVLDKKYRPVQNIKPRPPCCLTLKHNSSQHHFHWKSTYEEEIDFIALPNKLTYQLHFYQRGQQFNGKQLVNTAITTFTVRDDYFKPDSDYVAEVRSSPKRSYSEKGQWSDWSPKIHWRTQPTADENTNVFSLKKLLILVCVLVPIILSLCFTSVKKWKQVYIPTPEPYFHTLYTDCHGDFKSWVIMDNTVDLPITEKTNHIEKIIECEDIHEVAPSLPQGSGYANMSGSECVLPESGPPYAVSAPGCDSATVSCTSACLSSQSSPAEGDSGCWLSSDRSLEQNHLWYCNDYCTLSAFQQSALCTPSGSLKCGTCMIMRHDAIEETQFV